VCQLWRFARQFWVGLAGAVPLHSNRSADGLDVAIKTHEPRCYLWRAPKRKPRPSARLPVAGSMVVVSTCVTGNAGDGGSENAAPLHRPRH